ARYARQRPNSPDRGTRNVGPLEFETADMAQSGVDAPVTISHLYQRTVFRDPDVVPTLGSSIHTDDVNGSLVGRVGFDTRRTLGPTEHPASLGLSFERGAPDPQEQPDPTPPRLDTPGPGHDGPP